MSVKTPDVDEGALAALCAAGVGLVGAATFLRDGTYHPLALALVMTALTLVLLDVAGSVPARMRAVAARSTPWVLAIVVAGGLYGLLRKPPGIYLTRGTSLTTFNAGVVAAGVVALGYAWKGSFARWVLFPLAALVYLLLGGWMIVHVPEPFSDVWYFQQIATDAFLQGVNPWAVQYPNIYGGPQFYGEGVLVDGRVFSFPYTPLTLLLDVPGRLLGDIRWSLLAATAGTATFMVLLARRRGLPAGHHAELAAVTLLFHPRSFFLVEQSWTEPYLALGLAASAWALTLRGTALKSQALAFALSAKQYAFWWIPPLVGTRKLTWRDLGWAVAGATALHLPFLLWDPRALWNGLVLFQVRQPFRTDALSVLTLYWQVTGTALPSALGFFAGGSVVALAMWRMRRTLGFGVGATAAAMMAFFAFNKQAFFNYYWMVGAILSLAVVASCHTARDAGLGDRQGR